MATAINITERSREMFRWYAKDAGNWGGTPYLTGNRIFTREDRGSLTQLKKAGLLTTCRDEFGEYITFTQAGRDFAKNEFSVEIE